MEEQLAARAGGWTEVTNPSGPMGERARAFAVSQERRPACYDAPASGETQGEGGEQIGMRKAREVT